MHRIPIRDIMQTNVITIEPDKLVADAAQLMKEFKVRRLPVIDSDGFLIGIVTAGDVREAESAESVLNTYAPEREEEWIGIAEIMTREVVTIHPDATVGELAAKLIQYKIGGLPIVTTDPRFPKRQQLVGIVTETDIFNLIAQAWQLEVTADKESGT
jgi:acetoin utilization protein AcuB